MISIRIPTGVKTTSRRLAAALALAGLPLMAAACGQSGPPSPAGSTSATVAPASPGSGTGTGAGPGAACSSPAIQDPPECKLIRATIKGPSFARDGRTALVSVVLPKGDGSVEQTEVWDAGKGTFVKTLVKDLETHGHVEAAWSPDGRRVAAAGVGDSYFGFRIFDATTWKALHEEDNRYQFPCDIALDPAGERVAMTTLIGVAAVHDLGTGRKLASLATNETRAAGHRCSTLEWSGDGKALQVEGLREAASLRPVSYKPASATGAPAPGGKPVRPEDLVDVRLAPKGDVAAYLDRKGNVRLFSKHGTVPMRVLPSGKDVPAPSDPTFPPVRGLSWRPDALALATWDHTGKVRVWDTEKGEMLRELRAGAKPFEGMMDSEIEAARIRWAPDGRSFAFWDGEHAELWSVEAGAQKLSPDGAPKPETSTMGQMSFSPDGALLAVGRALYDTKSGKVLRTLPSTAAHWLDSGRFVVLAADPEKDGPLRLLRVADGAVLALERLGDAGSPVLLPHTDDGVFQGPRELAACAAEKGVAPEPRDSLLADFWAGKPVARTCPAR
jgi:WD40 repeat protein